MLGSPQMRLSMRLGLASLASAVAIGFVCLVGLRSLGGVTEVARRAVIDQIDLLNDTSAFEAVLYQKGFAVEYMLSGDRKWLAELENSRAQVATWLMRTHSMTLDHPARDLLARIEGEYRLYDEGRARAIRVFEHGDKPEAIALIDRNQSHAEVLLSAFGRFAALTRGQAEATLARAEAATRRLARLLVVAALLGAVTSVTAGLYWARRFATPIYQLQLGIATAAERTRLDITPSRHDLRALPEQVAAIVDKLEQADALLAEHRRRAVQNEKLSAIGQLAAQLAHEILNPLAGMKAAVQLLDRSGPADRGAEAVHQTALALSGEIARVESLVRRLVDFSRPLAPHTEVVEVSALVERAIEAASPELVPRSVSVQRSLAPSLPPLEIDPLLVTQALVNLILNAAQAMGDASTIEISAARASDLGRDCVRICVADHGPGIAEPHLAKLFAPFFTTKPTGHGLGLAISQNIVLEHGGRITGRNRTAGRGAEFEVLLPVVR
jgi:signal transduction histidine kinase